MIAQKRYQVWSATPTPFLADAALDEAGIARVVEQHLALGVEGLFAAGTCGEGAFMTLEQRVRLATLLKRHAGNKLHVAVQVTDTSSTRVRENMRALADAGTDSVVIAPPLLARFCNDSFARRYFFESIEAAPLPVGLYALRPPAAPPISLAVWREAALHPKVSYIKDSTSFEDFRRLFLQVRAERGGLTLLTGNEFCFLSSLAAGYDGVLAGTGILIAGVVRRALEAFGRGERLEAERLEQRAGEIMWGIFGDDRARWLGGLKYALVRLGVFSTEFLHLCYPLTAQDRTAIDRVLKKYAGDFRPRSTGSGS